MIRYENEYENQNHIKQLKTEIASLSVQRFSDLSLEIENDEKVERLKTELKEAIVYFKKLKAHEIKRSDERAAAALKRRDQSMEKLRVKMVEFANRIAQLDDLKTLHDEILELSKILYVANEMTRKRRLPSFNLGRLHPDQHHTRIQSALIRLFGTRLTDQRGFVDRHVSFDIRQQTARDLESIS